MAPEISPSLSLTGRRWQWPVRCETSRPERSGLPGWMETILAGRGVVGDEAVERYLEPSLSTLDDPGLMADMDIAVSRLEQALGRGEPITVYGDYDVDGVCSTTLMVEFLRGLGGRVDYYLPERRTEGYGLNIHAVAEIAKRSSLLVATDCGISAHEEISLARQLGLDVIVVDHHLVHDAVPAATATLDPLRSDCRYPFKALCATGVAFMLVMALRRALRERGAFQTQPEPDVRTLLDLVALATVADMVPVRDANRVLIAAGLRRMASGGRVGLSALLEVAKVVPAKVNATDLAFRLAPRLNARGRLGHAGEAVELLLTHDAGQARMLAAALDAANRERRRIEKLTVEHAMAQLEQLDSSRAAALVLYDPSWHPGVLGLVASRLVERFHRPAVVIGEGGRGSGRSVEGIDLHAALAVASAHLVRFGGHRAAAGVTIEAARVGGFREALCAEVERLHGAPPYHPTLRPDVELPSHGIDLGMVEAIERLGPFGAGNPEPLFVSTGLSVQGKRIVGGDHLKMRLGDGRCDAIGFGLAALMSKVPQRVDAVYRLAKDEYQGQTRLQLRVVDLRAAS